MILFKDRAQAGQKLADKIAREELVTHPEKTVVLGIARGGIVTAVEIARHFHTKLDIIVVKKLSAPADPELSVGAIGETEGSHYLEKKMIREMGITDLQLEEEIERKLYEIKEREQYYRQHHQALNLMDKDVIISDDGTATGATMIAAIREVWNQNPHRVIATLPVAPKDTFLKLEKEADSIVILESPEPFFSVSQFYESFSQVTDEEVVNLLKSINQ